MFVKNCSVIALSVAVLYPSAIYAQEPPASARVIEFPDIPGYLTLVCDFHVHTVFSDGSVWPDIRVQEALRDGIDAIAVTEHLEYLPHQNDIPHPDRDRAHAIAVESVGDRDLIVLNGSEITRDMPPGHANAIFLEDANLLLLDDPLEVFREAKRQGGFTFWNHPHWTSQRADGVATITEEHLQLIAEGLLQGIEVVNDLTYSDEALQIALDHDLTIMANSDIHGLVDWRYDVPHGGHRPVTLVFATERSAAGIKEGLEQGRTAAWFNNVLVGREEYVRPLVAASLNVKQATYQEETLVLSVMIENMSDVEYILDNRSGFTFHAASDVVTLKPHGTTRLEVKTLERLPSVSLAFEVLNAVTAPNTHPEIVVEIMPAGQ
ncbi:MAG: PHP domain-containing protein [Gemmatimonadota bacterium]|nr:MAG: PHP domain-containing protein [Gemmatimonadota bacterium]